MATFINTPGEVMIGRCSTRRIKYVQEGVDKLTTITLNIEPRDWDVTDVVACRAAAREQLGDDYDWYCEQRCAQWWVDPARNAAGLAVYRPRREQATT